MIRLAEGCSSYTIDGECCLMNSLGDFASFNESGTALAEKLAEGVEKEDLVAVLSEKYDMDESVLFDDVEAFLAPLMKSGFVEEML